MAKILIGVILVLSHVLMYLKGHNDGVFGANSEKNELQPKSLISKTKEISELAPRIESQSKLVTEGMVEQFPLIQSDQVAIEPDVVPEVDDAYRDIAGSEGDDSEVMPPKNEDEILEDQ